MSETSHEGPQKFRHADPEKVRIVWDVLEGLKAAKQVVPSEKLIRNLRKKINAKDDNIRLLLNEIEGDGLIDKSEASTSSAKSAVSGYRLPDFRVPFVRQDHDWYCYKCHLAGVVLSCSDCFRVFHHDCVNDLLRKSSPLRSPILHDMRNNFLCPVCESRPKCEFSRKQIRKLLEFATHHLRKQALWKTFTHLGYKNIVKNEFIVYKYIDLEILNQKIKDGRYTALENFAVDVELLVHNVCILHGPFSHEADEARFFLRSVKMEIIEIELCTDCYINAKAKPTDWISKPCKPCHEIIWASHRTPRGAGMFSDAVITDYFWPAKILLEKDDGFEIRFFGGTHERMFVRKEYTKSFKIPPSNVEVMRKSSNHGSQCGSGGFEKAWNEIQKLQNNIDSGYYTHSSGESDLPPSDDEYSDEMYVGPKRGKILAKFKDSNHLTNESPRSSLNSIMNYKLPDRKRHESSTSNQASSITSSINPSVSPNLVNPRPRGRPSSVVKKQKIQPEPGSTAALTMSLIAETKAALNSGSSIGLTKFMESTSASSIKPTIAKGKRKPNNSLSPKKDRLVRPEKRYKNEDRNNTSSDSSSSRDSSISSSSSRDSKFDRKKSNSSVPRPRGRPPSNGIRKKSIEVSKKSPAKPKENSGESRKALAKSKRKVSPKTKKRTSKSFKAMDSSSEDDDSQPSDDNEDELTDRCVSEDCSPSINQNNADNSDSNESDDSSDTSSGSSFLLKGVESGGKRRGKKSPSKSISRQDNAKKLSRKSTTDIVLKRPPFAPKPTTKGSEKSSSSKVFANSPSSQNSTSNLFASQGSTQRSSQANSSVRGVNGGVNVGGNNSSLSSGQNQAPNQSSNVVGKQVFSTTPLSTIPRSHLPPNKRAAAEAAAMAMQSAGIMNSQTLSTSSQTSHSAMNLAQNQTQSSLDNSSLASNSRLSPVLTSQKETQASNLSQLPCTDCKDREKALTALKSLHKQQMDELKDRLAKEFLKEKQSAISAAVDEIKTEFEKRIERETALNQKALEDAESKMTEAIIQTKRRQWCRNCLKEAIYHCCWNTSYCSIPCQQDHWQKEHKRQCRRKR